MRKNTSCPRTESLSRETKSDHLPLTCKEAELRNVSMVPLPWQFNTWKHFLLPVRCSYHQTAISPSILVITYSAPAVFRALTQPVCIQPLLSAFLCAGPHKATSCPEYNIPQTQTPKSSLPLSFLQDSSGLLRQRLQTFFPLILPPHTASLLTRCSKKENLTHAKCFRLTVQNVDFCLIPVHFWVHSEYLRKRVQHLEACGSIIGPITEVSSPGSHMQAGTLQSKQTKDTGIFRGRSRILPFNRDITCYSSHFGGEYITKVGH